MSSGLILSNWHFLGKAFLDLPCLKVPFLSVTTTAIHQFYIHKAVPYNLEIFRLIQKYLHIVSHARHWIFRGDEDNVCH